MVIGSRVFLAGSGLNLGDLSRLWLLDLSLMPLLKAKVNYCWMMLLRLAFLRLGLAGLGSMALGTASVWNSMTTPLDDSFLAELTASST